MKAFPKRPHHRFQDIPVGLVGTAFGFRLKFPVEFEHSGVRQAMTMACEQGAQNGKNPRLPINQGAVAVKADGGEMFEIHSRNYSESVRLEMRSENSRT